jgi:hypothetical protein
MVMRDYRTLLSVLRQQAYSNVSWRVGYWNGEGEVWKQSWCIDASQWTTLLRPTYDRVAQLLDTQGRNFLITVQLLFTFLYVLYAV